MRKDLRAFQTALVLVVWPLTTYAAGESLGKTFGAITLADWLTLLTLSSISAVVALFNRWRQHLEALASKELGEAFDPKHIIRLPVGLFAMFHMTGAWLASFVGFLVCEGFDLNTHYEAVVIALVAWVGSKGMEKWADASSERIATTIGGFTGSK